MFSVSDNWIGGSYYFLNIISALNYYLDDKNKPEIIIFSTDESGFIEAKKIKYPYLRYLNSKQNLSLFSRAVNKLTRFLYGYNIIYKDKSKNNFDVLFGYYEQLLSIKVSCKKIYWIPDFQEHFYPNFIGEKNTIHRKNAHLKLIKMKAHLVFSSKSAQHNFNYFYPNNENQQSIVKFAVTHPEISAIQIDTLMKKYQFESPYFFVANQFWPHKNHFFLLEVVNSLKQKGTDILIVFSGKLNNNDEHVKKLLNYIQEKQLQNNIRFLGFIPREEQLCIMKHSIAIIQPSLFEGWSTVVEDAKALGKYLIASDIEVHKEQLEDYNATFFQPNELKSLEDALIEIQNKTPIINKKNYNDNIASFAQSFLEAINAS